ncbi:SDR family oxidoreductase [Metapseudomonas lalkuanensis]|uniref:SDR family oxidoreductase n=1 Tax=Metapseudomonas lalkuanensis TaxID=2604832 RepID=A0A5J6QLA7_9GAMM|nr:SDR family oxidoreductase [Pseudomonas lalkuanensis]QEY61596.1 SDR family oxidoreductase [Pseudomonas lalkuanensis]UCO99360.1 SDR family oxidoreductase [Pseudomonas lalkuanensis]
MIGVLSGKTALITGGTGALARVCALALIRDGANVVLLGRRAEALEAARNDLLGQVPGAQVEFCVGDACEEADLLRALDQAYDLHQRLDILIPTVGGGGFRPLLHHDAKSFAAELDANLMSAFLAIRHGAPLMARNGGGSIVCISSTAAQMTFRWLSSYCTAKAALESLVRCAAEELASAGIRVNSVRPGLFRSEATGALFASPELCRPFLDEVPLGRLGTPADIAGAVRYLAGPESVWTTGQSLAIDGGNELRRNPHLDDLVAAMYGADAIQDALAGRAPLRRAE